MNKHLIILWILCIAGLVMFLGHYTGFLIDFGREVYYPERILTGDVLYKDLFNIYGPLSYQINACWYKIFGAKLSTLYGVGAICSLLVVSGIYLLANRYMSKFLSFCLGVFTVAVGVTTYKIFNFHFPYSWAVLYGLIAFIYSLYFIKNKLWLGALLAGICIACKYDFLLYGFVVLFLIVKQRDWKAFLCFAAAPVLSYGILFVQGLQISDLINSLEIVKNMAKTKTLSYFYQNSGIYFTPKSLLLNLQLFLKTAIPFGGILYGVYKDKKFVTAISLILFFVLFNSKLMFGFLPLVLMIFAVASYKKIGSNLIILILSVLLASAKVFWVLLLGSYGTYYVSILLVAFFALLFTYLPKKLEKTAGMYILAVSLLIFAGNISARHSQPPEKVVNYVVENTKPTDKVVVFPEGMIINFLSNRQSDGVYNSLLPLYVETFGEDKIIKHFSENKPEMIILNNLNMKDYYFEYICKNYALNFCGFIQENYELVNIIDDGYRYNIFMLK